MPDADLPKSESRACQRIRKAAESVGVTITWLEWDDRYRDWLVEGEGVESIHAYNADEVVSRIETEWAPAFSTQQATEGDQ